MIVTFLGTKGGTGTTTMAVNTGAELRRVAARSTAIVDLKPSPGDVALFLGLRTRHAVSDFVKELAWQDPGTAGRFLSEHPCGVHVLGAGEEWGRPSARDAEAVEQMLLCLASLYEFVVVDAGSTIGPATVAALQTSDLVVLVANPDVPCLRNLQRLIDAVKLSGVAGERLRVLLNRTSEFDVVSLLQIESVLDLKIDWSVSSDYRTVAAAVTSGVPVGTLRATALHGEIETIARAIAGDPWTERPGARRGEWNEVRSEK
jgi:pilus assembly protein CpaE